MPSPQPLPVDVVVVHHGDATGLTDALRCALDGATPTTVVVVHNGGEDPTEAATAAFAAAEVLRPDRNLGFAAGFDLAASRGSSRYVASITADTRCQPGYLTALISELESDPTIAAASGVLVLPDGRIDSTGIEVSQAVWARDRDRHRRPSQACTDEPFGVSGAAAVFRRRTLDEVGGFWDQLFVWWEDVEWAVRARRRGHRFAVVPSAVAIHGRGADGADPDLVEGETWRNRLATVARHGPIGGAGSRWATSLVTMVTLLRLLVRHPRALRGTVAAVRAGRRARRGDRATGLTGRVQGPVAPHRWGEWLSRQVGGGRLGLEGDADQPGSIG